MNVDVGIAGGDTDEDPGDDQEAEADEEERSAEVAVRVP